jgi:uncharacterized protein YcgI (DUF1989 family)
VPHGTAGLIRVKRGQFLQVTDLGGGQPAALLAFQDGDLTEFLSPHHTRVFSNSYILTLGMRMVSNRRRPMMVLGRDTTRRHDLLLPGSDHYSLKAAGLSHKTGSREAVQAALRTAGLTPPKTPDPINLFLDVAVELDGRLTIGAAPSAAGDHVVCRVLIDLIVVVAACASGVAPAEQAGPLSIAALNALT